MLSRVRHVPMSACELHRLIDGVVDADWRNPTWWTLCLGVALLEAIGRDPTQADDELQDLPLRYLNSNGDPRADTFMGRRDAHVLRPPDTIADAIASARAAVTVLPTLHDAFPGQPLSCYLLRERGLLWPTLLGSHRHTVAFATKTGAFLATLSPIDVHTGQRRDEDRALARALSNAVRGVPPGPMLVPIDRNSMDATRAAVAVSVGQEPLATVRHLHRRTWTRGGGPWIGIGRSDDLHMTTTCHMIVDGFGHTQLTCALFRVYDQLFAETRAHLLDPARPQARGVSAHIAPERAPLTRADFGTSRQPQADIWPLGVAVRHIPNIAPGFSALAYALGCTLDEYRSAPDARRPHRYTPAFQVPVAPGERADPIHWRFRVIPGLLSVRKRDGRFEPFDAFRQRVPVFLTRERQARGLLARLRLMVARLPIPLIAKRRIMSSTKKPHLLFPQIAALAGRGCLSFLRFPAHERPSMPLYGASAPALDAAPGDQGGSSVLTAISNPAGLALTLCGVGSLGTHLQAEAFLQRFLERLKQTQRA